ncbi:flagellar protein G [Halosimplex rubrum]|uniref:Flagellar protein G n=1 Tax=Halosimplex rubrum TaxID=869889 RepID=A0A7D5SS90_9EURY|nr:CARDB domain-containing protein [Halosimplex rubrum]QLH79347.1 flagellar protein G [Halosimplex rubrum]
MASVSVSHMILFIASMLVAASVAGVFTDTVGQLSNAIDDQGLQVSQDVRTDVEIISDSGSANVYDDVTDNVTLHVKNTGSETLPAEPSAVNVFVNGQFETDVNVSLYGEGPNWRPGSVLKVVIDRTDDPLDLNTDHRVKVVVNGDEEVFEFRT